MTKSWNTLLDNKVLGADNFYARVFKLRHKKNFVVKALAVTGKRANDREKSCGLAELARRGSSGRLGAENENKFQLFTGQLLLILLLIHTLFSPVERTIKT